MIFDWATDTHPHRQGLLAQLFCEIDAGAQTEEKRTVFFFTPSVSRSIMKSDHLPRQARDKPH